MGYWRYDKFDQQRMAKKTVTNNCNKAKLQYPYYRL